MSSLGGGRLGAVRVVPSGLEGRKALLYDVYEHDDVIRTGVSHDDFLAFRKKLEETEGFHLATTDVNLMPAEEAALTVLLAPTKREKSGAGSYFTYFFGGENQNPEGAHLYPQQESSRRFERREDEKEAAARRVAALALEKRRAAWEAWLCLAYENVDVVEKSEAFADFARTQTLTIAPPSEDANVARAARHRRLVAEAKIATETKARESLKANLRVREAEVASDIGEKELRAAQLARTVANLRARRHNLRDFVESRISWRESRSERADASAAQRMRLREEAAAASEAAKVSKIRAQESKERRDAEAVCGVALRDVAERVVDEASAKVRAARDAVTAVEERAARGRGRLGQRAAEAEAALHEARKATDARVQLEAVELPRCEAEKDQAFSDRRDAEDRLARHRRDAAARAARLSIELARRHDESDAAKDLVKFLDLKDSSDVDRRLRLDDNNNNRKISLEALGSASSSSDSLGGEKVIPPPTAEKVRESSALDAAAVLVVSSSPPPELARKDNEASNFQQQKRMSSPMKAPGQSHFEAAVMAQSQHYMASSPTKIADHVHSSPFFNGKATNNNGGGSNAGENSEARNRSRLVEAYGLAVRRVEKQLDDARRGDATLTASLEADLERARSAETALARVLAACGDRRDVLRDSARRALRASASAKAAKEEATKDLVEVERIETSARAALVKAEDALSIALEGLKAVSRETSAREKKLRHALDADVHVCQRHQAQATSEADALAVAEGRLLERDAENKLHGEDDKSIYRAISAPDALMTVPFAAPLLPEVLDIAQGELDIVETLIAQAEQDKTHLRQDIADVNAKWETESVATRARLHGAECQLRIFRDDAQAAMRMQRDIKDTVST